MQSRGFSSLALIVLFVIVLAVLGGEGWYAVGKFKTGWIVAPLDKQAFTADWCPEFDLPIYNIATSSLQEKKIVKLQMFLADFFNEPYKGVTTGAYDLQTEMSVKDLQEKIDIPQSGLLDTETEDAIAYLCDESIKDHFVDGPAPLTVSFWGPKTDLENSVINFGDGTSISTTDVCNKSTGRYCTGISHTYMRPGVYVAGLRSMRHFNEARINVTAEPAPSANLPQGQVYTTSSEVALEGQFKYLTGYLYITLSSLKPSGTYLYTDTNGKNGRIQILKSNVFKMYITNDLVCGKYLLAVYNRKDPPTRPKSEPLDYPYMNAGLIPQIADSLLATSTLTIQCNH